MGWGGGQQEWAFGREEEKEGGVRLWNLAASVREG